MLDPANNLISLGNISSRCEILSPYIYDEHGNHAIELRRFAMGIKGITEITEITEITVEVTSSESSPRFTSVHRYLLAGEL